MGGTGQLMARNVAENAEASPQSALLRSGRWTGLAAHTLRNIDSIYIEYRTGGQKSLEVAGVNVPMTMMRIGSVFKKPANDLMTPQEFMREVSRAHKRDRLEHDNPFVLKAAQETRKFYDEMRNAGIEVKYIPNDTRLTSISYILPIEPDFDANNMARYVDRWAPRQQWYAQDMVLQHEKTILNSSTATS